MAERVGLHVDADALWRRIRRSVLDRDGWAEKRGKAGERGKSIWLLDLHEGLFAVVIDDRDGCALTILAEGASIRTRSKGPWDKRRRRF